jgi:hypothetical protein
MSNVEPMNTSITNQCDIAGRGPQISFEFPIRSTLALSPSSLEKNQRVRPSRRTMSKKRKRHQDPEESVSLNDEASAPPQEDALEPEESVSTKKLTGEDAANVQKKIFHTVKETGRAFKKARDFELRKIIKRIKTAKSLSHMTILTDRDGNEVEKLGRLEKELRIAKVLHCLYHANCSHWMCIRLLQHMCARSYRQNNCLSTTLSFSIVRRCKRKNRIKWMKQLLRI